MALATFLESNPRMTIILIGSFVAASCALVGVFLVLRRMALLGDAISHAVLPGIVIAFLVTGSRAPLPMIAGAAVLGVITVFLVGLLNRTRRLYPEASIGVVFPALFSIGVILISRYAHQVDLDLDCVMFGELAYAPWDIMTWNGESIGPRGFWINGVVLIVNVIVITLFYKELKLTTFDGPLAATLGFSPVILHYLLMSLTSVTIVASFESVGAILVVAMLVVPPATAYLLTNRLEAMIVISVVLGVASAFGGYAVSRMYDCSVAGGMVAVAGAFFVAGFALSPEHGLIPRKVRAGRLARRFDTQLLLLHVGARDAATSIATIQSRFHWSRGKTERLVERLAAARLIEKSGESLVLTASGDAALAAAGTAGLAHRGLKASVLT